MWGERKFTLPDFHDDFHGSAPARASFTVLQALDCTIGGSWSNVGGGKGGDGIKGDRQEEGGCDAGLREEKQEKEGERRWHTG